MGYTFKSICIRNFKYITDQKPLEFQFCNKNIVILDGQNGYGKTTLFDAIEILLTGRIKHFNQDLQNRGKETLKTLANDEKKDIVISAILKSNINDEVHLKRKLLQEQGFESVILFNNEEILQKDLYKKLKFSLNMFDIGTYISQSQSLDFLQNKYKERKACVSSLLDRSEIENKIQTLKNIQSKLEEKVVQETQIKEKEMREKEVNITTLEKQVENTSSKLPGEDIRLFEDAEYPFDVIKIDESTSYEAIISPLKKIREFLENYEEYVKYINNSIIRELLSVSKKTYMALFYKKEIELLNTNEPLIQQLNNTKQLLTEFAEGKWSIDEQLFEQIGIEQGTIEQIKELLLSQHIERSKLEDADKVLAQMTKARKNFIDQFKEVVNTGNFLENKCPLCGTSCEDIDRAIMETETFIKNIHTDGVRKIDEIEKKIDATFTEKIIPCLQIMLSDNKIFIQLKDLLTGCSNLSTERLEKSLSKLNISRFESKDKENFDIKEFTAEFEVLQAKIQKREIPNRVDLSEKEIELYKEIHSAYYHDEKPKHTVADIQGKERYVTKLFNDKFFLQLSSEKEKIRKLEKDYKKYSDKRDSMREVLFTLMRKYEDANKDYQSKLANAIKIPLFVYSGRVIQNYPLGLGVKAVIKTNQLVFEAASKNGSDVYNILSTGQLNGLSIAFLLSIKNVYDTTEGLDILLIDDPLQTIDEISAISLADLLTQQGIGQIILSTHEDAKAALLRYKFNKAGLSVLEKNMQNLYMEAVMK